MAGREQATEALHVGPTFLHAAGVDFLADQLNAIVEPRLPIGAPPQTQATGPLFGQDAPAFIVRHGIGEFGRQRQSTAFVDRSLVLAGDESRRSHRNTQSKWRWTSAKRSRS